MDIQTYNRLIEFLKTNNIDYESEDATTFTITFPNPMKLHHIVKVLNYLQQNKIIIQGFNDDMLTR